MRWSRIGLERTDHDGCSSPVECWMSQCVINARQAYEWRKQLTLLVSDEITPHEPLPLQVNKWMRWHKERYGTVEGPPVCHAGVVDRSPWTFFASRCKVKGNGTVDPMPLPCGSLSPIVLRLRWRIPARRDYHIPVLKLFFQETRVIDLSDRRQRHYPVTIWREVPAKAMGISDTYRSSSGCYINIRVEVIAALLSLADAAQQYEHPEPFFRGPELLYLPVEEIVERHYEKKGGRSKSVLTFEKRKPF